MLVQLLQEINTDWKDCLLKISRLSWFAELDKKYTNAVQTSEVYPQPKNIFAAFNYFDIAKTEVVILGQDPYHDINQANGLCFGINPKAKYPPSLKNLLKELKTDLNIDHDDLSLVSWAKQGILLLNTSLSVCAHQPLSHKNFGWKNLILFILNKLLELQQQPVFLLLGKKSQELVLPLNPMFQISCAHPSPLSSYRFFGSRPFSQINELLSKLKRKQINW
ncbi:uracil-DNA glycosylase [[Mycoplasma] testudinis]|uniref:uracil-DNA glycosylase n=1 Tax=[Mycoplasma] testudinis TaxID=33924 RepID=UPI0004862C74|nr:uracil-DNA glycosylase [[Mycoplasma] testudinis]